MGWDTSWYMLTDGFDNDFGVDEWHGTDAFIRDDDDRIFRIYFIDNRGDEAMGGTWPTSTLRRSGARTVGGLAGGRPQTQATSGGTGTTNTAMPSRPRRPEDRGVSHREDEAE